MRAVYLERKSGPEGLVLGEIPRPSPDAGEVLIKVYATTVMPSEFSWFPTFQLPSGAPRPFPVVLSHELAGEIEALGAGVNTFKVGDEVYGVNNWFANGAQAECCVAPAASVARCPETLDHVQSAVVPISALTAWQGLFERSNLKKGQRVLIHGAAGGVGAFAVQLAKWRGASVIAAVSRRNFDFVRSLGADVVIDYRAQRFEDESREVDVVFDAVGGDTLKRSWELLREGGKLVTVASQSADSAEQRVRDAFMLMQANGPQLAEIAGLIDAGTLLVYSQGAFPLVQARDAYERASQGNMRGKIALSVVE
jgi:NADPH:quinone reductase-like Zn-dependent oxidoreductase